MMKVRFCPRCHRELHEPSEWDSSWHCDLHGAVEPLRPTRSPSPEGLQALRDTAAVPVWLPWPAPVGWLITGFTGTGDERSGTHACVVGLSGPNPVGALGEMLLISEAPGVGLGAGFAGLPGPDPGADFAAGQPHALVRFAHHEFPLWHVEAPGRAAFAGEVLANWLWIILWPDSAGVLVLESMTLRDLRDPGQDLDLPFGAKTERLPG
ncbi:MAG TPA: DUF6758 family protein [Streptosporangiaceae bacterium]|jgi:hypothetical protein|nr:DUF6758 family protein [Streptosporangiaceae bacterium]